MKWTDRHGPTFAALCGSLTAVLASRLSLGNDSRFAEESGVWFGQLVTPQWSGFVTVSVALLTILAVQVRRSALLVALAGVTGPVVIALPALVPVAGNQAVSVSAVGAGLLLGASAVISVTRRAAQVALIVGVSVGVLFWGAVRALLPSEEGRWLVSVGPSYVEPSAHPVVLLAVAVLVSVVALRLGPLASDEATTRTILALIALVFVYLLAYIFLGSITSATWGWTLAVVVSCASTLAASRLVDARDGVILMVGLAVAATTVTGLAWSSRSLWIALGGVAVLALAAVLGSHRPHVLVGLSVLACVAATGLLTHTAGLNVVPTVAYTLLFPAAVGFSLGSALPVNLPASAMAPAIPMTLTLFSVSAPNVPSVYYWTDGTATGYEGPVVAALSPLNIGVLVSVSVIVFAGLAIARRPGRHLHAS